MQRCGLRFISVCLRSCRLGSCVQWNESRPPCAPTGGREGCIESDAIQPRDRARFVAVLGVRAPQLIDDLLKKILPVRMFCRVRSTNPVNHTLMAVEQRQKLLVGPGLPGWMDDRNWPHVTHAASLVAAPRKSLHDVENPSQTVGGGLWLAAYFPVQPEPPGHERQGKLPIAWLSAPVTVSDRTKSLASSARAEAPAARRANEVRRAVMARGWDPAQMERSRLPSPCPFQQARGLVRTK